MTQNISATAATARENARNRDGKFGTQPLGEADLDLLGHDAGQSLEYRRTAADQLASRLRAQAAAAEAYSDDLLIYEVALAVREDDPKAKILTLSSDENDYLTVEVDGELAEDATDWLADSNIVERTRSNSGLLGHGLSTDWVRVRHDDYELVGTIDLDIAETNMNTVSTGLQPNTVYTDCSPLPQSDGQTTVVVECQGPSLTQISLSGTAASTVISDPESSWSVPVEATVDDPKLGAAYSEIGNPYRTER